MRAVDAYLGGLARLRGLRILHLGGNALGPAALEVLASLQDLRVLTLGEVDAEGLAALRTQLTSCDVV